MSERQHDPLDEIEARRGQQNLGTLAVRVYQGALEEAGDVRVAFIATVAYFIAISRASEWPTPEQEEPDGDPS